LRFLSQTSVFFHKKTGLKQKKYQKKTIALKREINLLIKILIDINQHLARNKSGDKTKKCLAV
jgi:hypothetical protein